MKFTVLGSTGFIGRRLTAYLRGQGHAVDTPPRDAENLRGKNLGHVIYAIGMTGNFRGRPEATIEAHVTTLQKLMDGAVFDSWLYLSSTRVYSGLPAGLTAAEDTTLPIRPGADSLYDLSKLLGEAICLGHAQPTVRVARLANVYGAGMSEHLFLGSVLRDLAARGQVTIGEAPASAKDYIAVDDVVATLAAIALGGRERLYNVASGQSVTHQALADAARQAGYTVDFAASGPVRVFPAIDLTRTTREFGGRARSLLADFPALIAAVKTLQNKTSEKEA